MAEHATIDIATIWDFTYKFYIFQPTATSWLHQQNRFWRLYAPWGSSQSLSHNNSQLDPSIFRKSIFFLKITPPPNSSTKIKIMFENCYMITWENSSMPLYWHQKLFTWCSDGYSRHILRYTLGRNWDGIIRPCHDAVEGCGDPDAANRV